MTTHVLDTTAGVPAEGISATLELQSSSGEWKTVGGGSTNSDGRIMDLLPVDQTFHPGIYRLTFNTGQYFRSKNIESFYPYVQIVFEVSDSKRHFHIPLLLNPFGYSTYRGS